MPGSIEVVVVAGMHRSGTSSLAGVLVKMGATAPRTIMEANEENKRGYWESWAVMTLNDDLLTAIGSCWNDWHPVRKFWEDEGFLARFRERAVATLEQEFGRSTFYVLKDPRLCRVLPFWLQILGEIGATARVVLPVRNPLEVAYSLRKRNRSTVSSGLLLWLTHMLDAESYSRASSRAIVDWADLLFDWRLSIARAGEHLGLEWPYQSIRNMSEVEDFLSEDLRHNVVSDADFGIHPDVNDWVKRTYRALQQLARDPHAENALRTLDEVRVEFYRATEIFGSVMLNVEKQEAELIEANRAFQEKGRASEERCVFLDSEVRAISEHRNRLINEVGHHAELARLGEQERDHLRHVLGQVRGEVSHHAELARSAEQERDHLRHVLGQVQGEAGHHAERARVAQQECDRLRHVFEQTQAERNSLAQQVEEIAAERDQVGAERDRSAAEREQFVDDIKRRDEDLKAMQHELAHVNEALRPAIPKGMLRRFFGPRSTPAA
jgi:hypothetical protein